MNTTMIRCVIAALSVGLSGVALAQDDKDVRSDNATNQRPVSRQNDHHGNGNGHYDRNDRGRNNGYSSNHHDDRYQGGRPDYRGRDPRWEGRGAGPEHNFYRGGRLPVEYRSRGYVVDDWRGHRLSAPPRGYHWVQTGGDYVLVAIATGLIADILINQ